MRARDYDQPQWRVRRLTLWNAGGEHRRCWRCHELIQTLRDATLGHVIDAAVGGTIAGTRLEHAACNYRAGQALGEELRRVRRARPGRWVTAGSVTTELGAR